MTDPYKCLKLPLSATSMEVEKSRFQLIEGIEEDGYGPGNLKYREIIWSAELLKDRERRAGYEKVILASALNNVKGLEIEDLKISLLGEIKMVLTIDQHLAIINEDVSDFDFSFCFFSIDEHLDAGRMLAAFLTLLQVHEEINDNDIKPRILFKIADFFSRRLKNPTWAKVFFNKIIEEYPKSREALHVEDLL